MCTHGLRNTNEIQGCAGVWIYPKEYFCPKDYESKELIITANTRTIHHYDGSWMTNIQKQYLRLASIIGHKNTHRIALMLKTFHIIK